MFWILHVIFHSLSSEMVLIGSFSVLGIGGHWKNADQERRQPDRLDKFDC